MCVFFSHISLSRMTYVTVTKRKRFFRWRDGVFSLGGRKTESTQHTSIFTLKIKYYHTWVYFFRNKIIDTFDSNRLLNWRKPLVGIQLYLVYLFVYSLVLETRQIYCNCSNHFIFPLPKQKLLGGGLGVEKMVVFISPQRPSLVVEIRWRKGHPGSRKGWKILMYPMNKNDYTREG